MLQEGALEGLTEVINIHSKTCPETTEAALWALVNMTCDSEIATVFGQLGGIVVVTDLLHELAGRGQLTSLLQACICVVRNLSSATAYNYSILAGTTICEDTACILSSSCTANSVAEVSLYTLSNLSCDLELAKRVLGIQGCIETVMKILNMQLTGDCDEALIEAAVWTVRTVAAGGADSQTKLHSVGALGSIATAFDLLPDQTANLCAAVLNLIADFEPGKSEAVSLDFCLKLCLALKNKYTDPALSEFICKSLSQLAMDNPSNREKVVAEGGRDMVVRVLSLHRGESQVVRAACEALLHLHFTTADLRTFLKDKGALSEEGKAVVAESFEEVLNIWVNSDQTLRQVLSID